MGEGSEVLGPAFCSSCSASPPLWKVLSVKILFHQHEDHLLPSYEEQQPLLSGQTFCLNFLELKGPREEREIFFQSSHSVSNLSWWERKLTFGGQFNSTLNTDPQLHKRLVHMGIFIPAWLATTQRVGSDKQIHTREYKLVFTKGCPCSVKELGRGSK